MSEAIEPGNCTGRDFYPSSPGPEPPSFNQEAASYDYKASFPERLVKVVALVLFLDLPIHRLYLFA